MMIPINWRNVRRKQATAALGIAGILALPGSQYLAPQLAVSETLSSTPVVAEPLEGQAYYVDTLWPGVISPLPSVQPVATQQPGPYGLASPSALTSSGIPAAAYRAYVNAAADLSRTDPSCGIHWSVLAGIGRVESNHGRFAGSNIGTDGVVTPPILGIRLDGSRKGTARISDSDGGHYDGDPLFDRAVGPMQFLPGTWKAYGNGANPQDMNAAALAAGRYLCQGTASLSTSTGRWAAVYRYNHSDSYVSLVLSLADSYASGNVAPFTTRPAGLPEAPAETPSATAPGQPPSVPIPAPSPIRPTSGPVPSAPGGGVIIPGSGSTATPTTAAPVTTGPTTPPAPTTLPATTAPPQSTTPPASTAPPETGTTSPAATPTPDAPATPVPASTSADPSPTSTG